MASYATSFAGAPGTWLEAFDGWRIIYADGGLTQRARISSDGAGVDLLSTGALGTWVIYSPGAAMSPSSANHFIRLTGPRASSGPFHGVLRASPGGKDGFVVRFASGSFAVWRSDAGALTQIGSGTLSPGLSTTDVFELAADGSTLALRRNGAQIWAYGSATQYQGGTCVGFVDQSASSYTKFLLGFESGDLGSGQQDAVGAGGLPEIATGAPLARAAGAARSWGALPAVQVTASGASASGGAAASAPLPTTQMQTPQATATGAALATAALPTALATATEATATAGGAGEAAAALPTVIVSGPLAAASGGGVASILLSEVTIFAPQAQADAGARASAEAALADVVALVPGATAAGGAWAMAILPAFLATPPEVVRGRSFVPALNRGASAGGNRYGYATGERAARAVRQ